MRAFQELVDEAAAADLSGWSFDWFNGRATEQRPPWRYSRLLASRLPRSPAALDIDTGGGERVLQDGGSHLAQHVGPASAFALIEYFRGPLPHQRFARDPHREVSAARSAGLEIVDLRTARCRMEFFDIGAVVYTLRKCAWWVPDFAAGASLPPIRPVCSPISDRPTP